MGLLKYQIIFISGLTEVFIVRLNSYPLSKDRQLKDAMRRFLHVIIPVLLKC